MIDWPPDRIHWTAGAVLLAVLAFCTGGRLVWLRDFDDEATLSIARHNPAGRLKAKRWPFSFRSPVLLQPGGTVERAPCYVKGWTYALRRHVASA